MPRPKNMKNNSIRASKRVKTGFVTRKIRLICNDPDATDLSSDDELSAGSHKILVSHTIEFLILHRNLVLTQLHIQLQEETKST